MGFTFNSKHSDYFGICVRTESIPYIASKRQAEIEVEGRDGLYIFEDGYNNIQISLACSIANDDLVERRALAREIAEWLSTTGELIFDYDPDIAYQVVKVVSGINGVMRGYSVPVDDFNVVFECEPYQEQTFYNDDEDRIFEGVVHGQTINVENLGTYKALPIIILTGTAENVTVGGFTFNALSGTIYIDCKNMVVYSLSGDVKTNKMSSFLGTFPELQPGINSFDVIGTITNLDITFDFKNTFL